MDKNILKIVIITKEGNLKDVVKTYSNISRTSDNKNCIIALKKGEESKIKQYCTEKNIEVYEYENQNDVFFDLANKLNSEYVCFINEGDTFSSNILANFKSIVEKDNCGRGNIYVCDINYDDGQYILAKNVGKKVNISVELTPNKIWINKEGCFISTELLKKAIQGGIIQKEDSEQNIITKLISINGGYRSLTKLIKLHLANKLEDDNQPKNEYYDLNWYYNIFDDATQLLNFSEKRFNANLEYIQFSIMYRIKQRINANVNTKNKHILKGELLDKFENKLKEILLQIDDQIIRDCLGNKRINYCLLKLKYDKDDKVEYKEFINNLYIYNNNLPIFEARLTKIKILLMDFKDGNLKITANYPIPFDEQHFKICVEYDDKQYFAKKNNLYSDYKAFGKTIYSNYMFDLDIPLKVSDKQKYIDFYLLAGNAKVKLDINFIKPLTRLSNNHYSYWNIEDFTLNYKRKSIMVLKRKWYRTLNRERKYLCYLFSSDEPETTKSAWLRIVYFITKPFFRKQIWLFEDKIYKGGDNGEYLYTYATQQKDGIKKYYVLNKGTDDSKRFKAQGKKFLEYGTIKHKLVFLNSNIVFETHNSATGHHSFGTEVEEYFRDLYKANDVCIQHGLSVQYIPHLVNRINDDLQEYFLASSVEKKNLLNKEYAYEGYEDILKITGSPRYDGLHNNDKKQILITPSWRNYLAMPSTDIDKARNYNNNFKKSDYFKIYNNLINSKKLIEKAQETGYKIIYLLHPCTSSQIDDYDKNDSVELIAATDNLNYEKILTESSLMVTDYSGVQFDFAYMYKPIVYFHPKELPPSYDEGEYKYETMSLGEIVTTTEELVDTICDYMENKCKIKDEYKTRIDKFFKYHDYHNCERVYNEIMNKFYKK